MFRFKFFPQGTCKTDYLDIKDHNDFEHGAENRFYNDDGLGDCYRQPIPYSGTIKVTVHNDAESDIWVPVFIHVHGDRTSCVKYRESHHEEKIIFCSV